MGNNGWICIYRKMKDANWYKNTAAKSVALHLLLSATHKDIPFTFGTHKGVLLRGQYVTGRLALARELGMRPGRVRGALKTLEESGFLTSNATNRFSIITICNYNAYQTTEPDANQQFNQRVVPDSQQLGPNQPAARSQIATKQQLTINNNKQYILSVFEELWSNYPKKDGKRKALLHFTAEFNKTNRDNWDALSAEYKQALVNYNNSRFVQQGDPQYIKNGSTWFYNWKDWVTNPESSKDDDIFNKIKRGLK